MTGWMGRDGKREWKKNKILPWKEFVLSLSFGKAKNEELSSSTGEREEREEKMNHEYLLLSPFLSLLFVLPHHFFFVYGFFFL